MSQEPNRHGSNDARCAWLAILARAPLEMLEAAFKFLRVPGFTWLRRPESGLYTIRARVGGSGNRFNVGEATVTRCVVRLSEGPIGVGYVLGRSHRHAELCALADAMLQSANHRDAVNRVVIGAVQRYLHDQQVRMARKAESTRVEFLTMAREAGSMSDQPRASSEGTRSTEETV